MTQPDLFLANQPGASFRAELNQIIESLATNSAGTVAPSPTFPSQWFADYTANMLRRRRKDNTAWVDVSPIDEALLKATTAETRTGTDATKAVTPAGLHAVYGAGAYDCHLDFISSLVIRLSPFNGNKLTIDDVVQTIPLGGVDLAPQAWGPVYYIYAFMNTGTMTLEASTTTYALDARNGMAIKAGDASRTLVGMALAQPGNVWVDSPTQRFVASYYNRRRRNLSASHAGNATGSATPVQLSAYLEFLTWASGENQIMGLITGYAVNSLAANTINTDFYVDGAGGGNSMAAHVAGNGWAVNVGLAVPWGAMAEGYHKAASHAWVSAGVGTWYGVTHAFVPM